MLRKILSVKNVGRFRNSAASGNPELARYTLISGANGYGKTTLCAVLRSLKSGDPAHITGRRTLGVQNSPTVELLLRNGPARFDGQVWSTAYPAIAIFDGVFVAENVHSGEIVDIEQKRNLYRVIIGDRGVQLAEQDTRLAAESRAMTGAVSGAAKAIDPHIPAGVTLDEFLALAPNPEIGNKITDQERIVAAVLQAQNINDRAVLFEIQIPLLPDGFDALLARTIDDISQDAEEQLSEHLTAHGMTDGRTDWIASGIDHAGGGTCPFCGQNIQQLPLISAYRAIFSARYKTLRRDIAAMRASIAERFGAGAAGRLDVISEQNKSAIEFWSRYCELDSISLTAPSDMSASILQLGVRASDLLDRKDRAALEPLSPDGPFMTALGAYKTLEAQLLVFTGAIRDANALIAAKKLETGIANVRAAEHELQRLRAVQVRHTAMVVGLCNEYVRLNAEKRAIDERKAEIRTQLDSHTVGVLRPYERSINNYLELFNAGFSIAQTRHGYPGGPAASSYQLIINDTAVEIGDGKTPPDRPSFKNTLSAGDRATLALAFFLSHLEADQNLAAKPVVFDDPFASQDAFRRRQTVHEIAKIARRAAQVIVLSHDATFLKQVWDKAPPAERVALTIVDHRAQGAKLVLVDLERACLGRTATDIDDLQAYIATGAGNLLDLVRKMRVVLETHCWTDYPAAFDAGNDWLGEIARKIREEGDQHQAYDLYDSLDQINDYTSQYYHGEDVANATPDQIDPRELTGYVKRTLRLVNALQA
jgi:wobble nucleotide-excising tRNase